MLLSIARLGQPVLRRRADAVLPQAIRTSDFQQFLADMRQTVEASRGAGLAAPQVFQSVRVFLATLERPTDPDALPCYEVFINPTVRPLTADQGAGWEGCLSFEELIVLVPRFRRVRVDYLNADGEPRTIMPADFSARVVQHEFDHLEGVLTLDRAESPRHIVKASEIEAVLAEEERVRQLFG